ncbi:MAG: endo-1,4-beta-xylanase [Lachnospiraceae bacterium]|nr:endo-1,4-beta-xylanase [Lachnospiraceae bacterium]
MRKGFRKVALLLVTAMLISSCGCSVPDVGSTPDVSSTPDVGSAPDVSSTPDVGSAPDGDRKPGETAVETEGEIYFNEYASLAGLAKQYGFSLGTVIGDREMADEEYKELVEWHFNSLTAGNEMKAYSLLDQKASQENPDGMPVMNYEKADKIVAFAQENKIAVRGHTLVWDAYMADWFFREGYKNAGEYVDAETMKERLKYYINDVISHFEHNFPGVVYCWDVVNEAVADDISDCAENDLRRIRRYRNGEENPFYAYIGPEYVELAFLYAADAVDMLKTENPEVNIQLFYNDYNTFYEEKRDAICALAESINSFAEDENGGYRKLCDGIGMQSYIGGYGKQAGCMNENDLLKIEEAILLYASMGLTVHATELAVRNYEADAYETAKHAAFYQSLFEVYVRVNSGEEKPLASVSIWGLCDNPGLSESDYGYKMNGPYCGLFDEKYNVKDSFKEVYEFLKP